MNGPIHLPDLIAAALSKSSGIAPSSDFDLGRERPKNVSLRDAAVLIGLQEDPIDAWRIWLTRRPLSMATHAGQVALPGGKVEAGEDAAKAALREAEEEIAIPQSSARIFGKMPTHQTVSNFRVTPVLAEIDPSVKPYKPTTEVAEVFSVPASFLLDPDNYVIHSRDWLGVRGSYYTIPYGPYYIWGATARILRQLAGVISDEN